MPPAAKLSECMGRLSFSLGALGVSAVKINYEL